MESNKPSRAERMAAEIQAKVKQLQEVGEIEVIDKPDPTPHEKDTAAMKSRRRIAVEKLRTFLD